MLFWFLIFITHTAETGLLMAKKMAEHESAASADASSPPEDAPHASSEGRGRPRGSSSRTARNLGIAHRIVYGVKTVLPKTTETIGLLERTLISAAALPNEDNIPPGQELQHAATQELISEIRARSAWWVLGTSLAFEAVILALAGWVFRRRDF
jgi:hypothetical protein